MVKLILVFACVAEAPARATDTAAAMALLEKGDDTAARQELLVLAKQGDPLAQNNLAVLYAEGRGGEQSYEKAAGWYMRAAMQGLTLAQYNLAGFYEKGLGLQRDLPTAAVWYRMAAMKGDSFAQFRLGRFHSEGIGVPLDNMEAYFWLSLALDNASDADLRENAATRLALVEKRLSDEKLLEAKLLVSAWQQQATSAQAR